MQSLYDSSNYTKHYDFCRDYCPFDNCLYNCFASLEEDLEQEKLSGWGDADRKYREWKDEQPY